jgi:hypothetical protein
MAAEAPPIDPAAIVAELRELRSRRATGTYYVVSDDNRQGRIALVAGEIASISFRGAEGDRAIEALITMRVIRTRFANDGLRAPDGGSGSLNTDAVFKALLGRAPTAATASSAAAAGPRVSHLPAAAHQAIRQSLTHDLGPIADLVYEEHRAADPPLETMLLQLAAEIPDSKQATEFLALVRRRLQQTG